MAVYAVMAGQVTQALPRLLDAAGIRRETGLGRRAAEAIMRELPKITIPGHSKTYVKRDEVLRLLDDGVLDAITVRARKRRQEAA